VEHYGYHICIPRPTSILNFSPLLSGTLIE